MSKFEVTAFIDADQLNSDLAYSEADISEAYIEQAPLFAHYSGLSAKAQHQAERFKMFLEIKEAQVDQKLRDEAANAGEKITEARIEKKIALNTEVVNLKVKLNDARMIADLAKNSLEAFKQRRDTLIQIGVGLREDRKNGLSVSSEIVGDAVKDRAKKHLEKNATSE